MKVLIVLSSILLSSSLSYAGDGIIPVTMKKLTGNLTAEYPVKTLMAKIDGKYYFLHATEENAHKACIRAGYNRATSIQKFSLEEQRDRSTYSIVKSLDIDGSEPQARPLEDSALKLEALFSVDCEKDL